MLLVCVYVLCACLYVYLCEKILTFECHQFLNAMAADNEDVRKQVLFFFKFVIDLN